jgi:stage II sporulation protein R
MDHRATKSPLAIWYTLFALTVLVMGWEANLNAAALAAPTIPENAIRIRILANSDAPRDQWIKKQVREAIVAEVNGWGLERADADEARAIISDNLAALQSVAEQTLDRYGFSYDAATELSRAAFPAKTFEGTRYPAGEYETLLITLGAGRGENWWCVLFPPLCFAGGTVTAKAGEPDNPREGAEPDADRSNESPSEKEKKPREANKTETGTKAKTVKDRQTAESEKAGATADGEAQTGAKEDASIRQEGVDETGGQAEEADVEVRLFFVDLFKKGVAKVKALFA